VLGGLQRGDGTPDGGPHVVTRLEEAPVEVERQTFHPVGEHDAYADAVHDHRQVLAQLAEGGGVQASGEHGLGEHVERELDHGLADVQGLAGRPFVDGGGDFTAHDVDVAGYLGAAERRLQLPPFADVFLSGDGDHGLAQQLAHLLEEPALVQAGAEVGEHGADQFGVLHHDRARARLEGDLHQRAVVLT
jgi:hypothetical protein